MSPDQGEQVFCRWRFEPFSLFQQNILLGHGVEISFFKSLLSLHSLKIEKVLHAVSFIGLPRTKLAAPDTAIKARIKQRCRERPVCPLSSFGFVDGGAKGSVTRRNWRCLSAMAFFSLRRRFTQFSITSAKPAKFANILLVLTTQYMCVE